MTIINQKAIYSQLKLSFIYNLQGFNENPFVFEKLK